MSSLKLKKKSKSTKIPEPIKIKKEDDHLICPMEHYVDDRVELIRQIFSSLKPKTITNLAPDFLKKQKLEEIQEQCLNEILGISKKRLLSIINSTKCPTDTETSDEDDVNPVTEHISLEEISSDSDINESKVSKGTGKKKQKVKKEPDSTKQFSVLELLELQARARAIRSQLALEPVTKIEVDTDSEEDGPPKQKPPSGPPVARKKTKKTTNGGSAISKSDAAKKQETPTLTVIIPNGEPVPSKPIKLKRNFRKQPRDEVLFNDTKSIIEVSNKTPGKILPKTEGRSPSPDVIPIVSVPETLCISDSDEEKKIAKNVVEFPEVVAKDSQQLEILSVINIEGPSPRKPESETKSTDEPLKASTLPQRINPPESEEEGEIVEDEEEQESVSTHTETVKTDKHDNAPNETIYKKEPETTPVVEKNETINVEEKEAPLRDDDQKPQKLEISEGEDDDNDDVISLEGADLVNEMKEHMQEDVEEVIKQNDVICLDDSSEEEAKTKKKTESWNDRWLNSRRVSKVLAASRLGNKVRKKIKETKKAKKIEALLAIEKEKEKPQQVVFMSNHEIGSVDQYKELLESLPKKSAD